MPLVLAAAALMWSGCGRGDRPNLGKVRGIVTLDGKPLAGASVHFDPGTVRGSTGITGPDGGYELVYIRDTMGAAVGEHTVRIRTQTETTPEVLPPRYHAQSTLTATVTAGRNEINFPLTSQPHGP